MLTRVSTICARVGRTAFAHQRRGSYAVRGEGRAANLC